MVSGRLHVIYEAALRLVGKSYRDCNDRCDAKLSTKSAYSLELQLEAFAGKKSRTGTTQAEARYQQSSAGAQQLPLISVITYAFTAIHNDDLGDPQQDYS